jgi:hypothetical protein
MSLFFAKIIRKYTYKFAEKGHFVSVFWGSFAKIIRKYTYKFNERHLQIRRIFA